MAGQTSLQDGNQQVTLIVSQGTVGTAALDGTALTMRLNGDPVTGALYVNDLSGSGGGGTTVTVDHGSIVVTAGTVNVGTVVNNGGTIDMLKAGTLTTIPNIPGGTIGVVQAGTINSATVVLNSGTITNGTIATNLLPLAGITTGGTQVPVGTSATAIPAIPLSNRKSIIIYNVGTSRIWLTGVGGGGTTGIPLGTSDYSPSMDLGTTILYGVADTVGGTVTTFEVS